MPLPASCTLHAAAHEKRFQSMKNDYIYSKFMKNVCFLGALGAIFLVQD